MLQKQGTRIGPHQRVRLWHFNLNWRAPLLPSRLSHMLRSDFGFTLGFQACTRCKGDSLNRGCKDCKAVFCARCYTAPGFLSYHRQRECLEISGVVIINARFLGRQGEYVKAKSIFRMPADVFRIRVPTDGTIAAVKQAISAEHGAPPSTQVIMTIRFDTLDDDDELLHKHDLKHGSVILFEVTE